MVYFIQGEFINFFGITHKHSLLYSLRAANQTRSDESQTT